MPRNAPQPPVAPGQPALFDPPPDPHQPLAVRMRPRTVDEFAGQEHLLGPGKALRRALEQRRLGSDHPLGAARHRQDQPGPASRPRVSD